MATLATSLKPESPTIQKQLYAIYRDYFDRAEKKRRWSLVDDIPWDKCNRNLDPAIADIVQTFCSVEMYLPDYLGKLMPQVRAIRGRAWMLANWGYEESKHSMAFGDWLLKSGHRTEEEMTDLEAKVFQQEWELPYDNARAMVIYTMFQELATWLHYKNLQKIIGDDGDPALHRCLHWVAMDERAHYDFFRKMVELYLVDDREGTLEQLRLVANTFMMPAVHLIFEGRQRVENIKALRIFDYDIFYYQVFEPVLEALKVDKRDLRRRTPREIVVGGVSR